MKVVAIDQGTTGTKSLSLMRKDAITCFPKATRMLSGNDNTVLIALD